MNKEEIARQIAKFKTRRLKSRLAGYGTFVSIFLTLSTLSGGLHLSTLFSLLLILPLPLYFVLQSLKFYKKNRDLKTRMESLNDLISGLTQPKFSLIKFISQPNLAFRLSLILFFLVVFTTFARLHTLEPVPAITYNLSTNN